MMKTLAIIPAYNESKTISAVSTAALLFVSKVLVIDDGSTDDTAQKARGILLKNQKNRGKGHSLKRGFQYAMKYGYDAVITLDADGEHDPKEIPRFLRALGHADLVIGQRNVQRSRTRTFLNWFSSFFMRMIVPELNDTQSGYRAIRTGLLKKMSFTTNGFDLELEMILEAIKHKARICPIYLRHTPTTKSHTTFADYVRINNLFDKWYLKNAGSLFIPCTRKMILYIACSIGIGIGKLLEKLS